MRAHSQPSAVIASPGSLLFEDRRQQAEGGLRHVEHTRGMAKLAHDMSRGSAVDYRPVIVAPATKRSLSATAASASMKGSLNLSGLTEDAFDGFNSRKHGWHIPHAHAEQTRLLDPAQEGSWAWTMRKARDHIGYGDISNPCVNRSDFQGTTVSGDAPNWFIGLRTMPGPMSTKAVPARRCPRVTVEGKNMKVRSKTFERGDCLSTTVHVHDSSRPPTPPPRQDTRPKWMIAANVEHLETPRAKRCHLQGSGGRPKAANLPVSNFTTKDPRYMHLSMHTMRAG